VKKGFVGFIITAIVVVGSTAPVLADSHQGSSEWTKKEQHLASSIADTLQTYVPKVETVESALATKLNGSTVTSSVYLSQTVTTDLSTIQLEATQLQTGKASDLLKELKVLEKQIERTKEAINHVKSKSNESSKSNQNHLRKLVSENTKFEQSVIDLKAAYQTLQADPTLHSAYNKAKKAWKQVEHEGKKIVEWSKEWSSVKGG